jgi:hypothetical protein
LVCTSAQKVDNDKKGDGGGNYLDGTETAQTISNRCVRLPVQPVSIHRAITSDIHPSRGTARRTVIRITVAWMLESARQEQHIHHIMLHRYFEATH